MTENRKDRPQFKGEPGGAGALSWCLHGEYLRPCAFQSCRTGFNLRVLFPPMCGKSRRPCGNLADDAGFSPTDRDAASI